MAINEIGRNQNIYQATKGEKIAPAKELDLTEYNKKYEAKVAKREEFETISNKMRASGLPLKYQSILDREMKGLDEQVDAGLSTDSKEYRRALMAIQNDALKMGADVEGWGAGVTAYQKDPTKFKSLKKGAKGNPQYDDAENGILNQYSYYNEEAPEGMTADQAIGGSQRSAAENLVFAQEVDQAAMTTNAKSFFDSNYERELKMAVTKLPEVYSSEDIKRLEGDARKSVILAYIKLHQEDLAEIAKMNGDPQSAATYMEIVDKMIPKEETEFKTGKLQSAADKAYKWAQTKKINKENRELGLPAIVEDTGNYDATQIPESIIDKFSMVTEGGVLSTITNQTMSIKGVKITSPVIMAVADKETGKITYKKVGYHTPKSVTKSGGLFGEEATTTTDKGEPQLVSEEINESDIENYFNTNKNYKEGSGATYIKNLNQMAWDKAGYTPAGTPAEETPAEVEIDMTDIDFDIP